MSNQATNSTDADQIPNMIITPTAQEYLKDLLAKQNTPGIGVRIFVESPGTSRNSASRATLGPPSSLDETTRTEASL